MFGALLALTPLSLSAAPVWRSGETITIGETQEVQDDFYAAGIAVTMLGKIAGDLYAAGGTVTINGEITEDAVVIGDSVRIDGSVGDDIRMIGGKLEIAGTVKGDVLIMGGVVHILPTARIDGDLLFFGGDVTMDGNIRGALSGRAETLRVNGPVLGDISVTTAKPLELGDQAHVEGAIAYASAKDIARAPGSVVIGDITKKELLNGSGLSSFSILPLLAFFFTTLAYLLLCKTKIERVMRHSIGAFGWHGLLGFGVFLMAPIVATMLLISVIGLPVGITLLLLYVLLLTIALSLVGIFAGAVLARYVDGEVNLSLKWTLLGTLALALLLHIPYVGVLVAALFSLIILGGISSLLYARIRA